MDLMKQLESGYLHVNDLNNIVLECREMAHKLDVSIRWRVKDRTATACLKWAGNRILWKATFTHELPHIMLFLMYHGIHTELTRRYRQNQDAIIRMQQAEEERQKERQVMNMQDWAERHKR